MLLENEKQFRILSDCAPVCIFMTDTSGQFTYLNPRCQSVCGFTLDESQGKEWTRFVHPDDRELVSEEWSASIRNGSEYFQEIRFRNIEGVVRRVRVRSVPMFSDGRLIGHAGTMEDIKEYSSSEREWQEHENKYRMLLEQASDGIHTYDLEGNMLEVNSRFCEMFGYTREEALRLKVQEFIPAEDLAVSPLRFDELRDGKTIISERKVRRKDGTLFLAEISGRMIYDGVLQAIIRDCTERNQAEAKLKRSEEWLRTIFEASRDGIVVEDDELIMYSNSSYIRLLGYEETEELLGLHISAVVSPEDKDRLIEYGERRKRGEHAPLVYEFQGKRKDGELIDLEASVSTSMVDGKIYITTSIRDIAERKQAARALQQAHEELEMRVRERTAELTRANEVMQMDILERKKAEEERKRLLGRLVSAQEEERRRISLELHDRMGQHLTMLMLGIKTLKGSSQAEESTSEHIERLETLVEEIDGEVDRLTLELRPTALDDLGLHMTLTQHVAEWSKQSQIPVDYYSLGIDEERLPPDIETALYRIIQEALTNILKHAEARSASIIVKRRESDVLAIIEDDGRGFALDAVNNSPASPHMLGLLGMRERAEMFGGTFNIESTVGNGTALFIHLPLTIAKNEEGRIE